MGGGVPTSVTVLMGLRQSRDLDLKALEIKKVMVGSMNA